MQSTATQSDVLHLLLLDFKLYTHQWRIVVKLAGRAAKFHLWLNILDCHHGCFYNIVAFTVTPAALILSNS